jgi:hypothetical protein
MESGNPGRGLEEWPVNDSTVPAPSLLGAVEDLPRKKPGSAADADEYVGDSSHMFLGHRIPAVNHRQPFSGPLMLSPGFF